LEGEAVTTVQVISGSLEDRLRRELVYAGDLLVFKGVGQMSDLCDLTDELVCEALDASEPVGRNRDRTRELCRQGRGAPEAIP